MSHGSVGPEHVIVLPDGRARLGGFAVSRALATTEPDQWSDAYDFAMLAHHTLAGGPPPLSADDPWPPLPWRAAEVLLASLTDRPQERPLPHDLVEVLRGIVYEDSTVSPAPVRQSGSRNRNRSRTTTTHPGRRCPRDGSAGSASRWD